MNLTLLVDDYMADLFESMAPYKNVMDQTVPRKISGGLAKSKPWISIMGNFLEAAPHLPPDPIKLQRMLLIPEAP